MQASLRTMLELERYDALDACGPSSSLVDLFTQLDSIAGVYVAFAAPQSLPPTMHQQLLDLIETQASQYVMMLVSGCAALPTSGQNKRKKHPNNPFSHLWRPHFSQMSKSNVFRFPPQSSSAPTPPTAPSPTRSAPRGSAAWAV